MIFRPELAQAVMDGRKTVTRRLVREDNPRSRWHPDNAPKLVGKRLAVQPGRGKRAIGTVQVVSVTRDPEFVPLDISDEEAIREGFADTYWRSPWSQFCAVWRDIHGDDTCPYDVWRIEFTDPAPAGREENA